MHLISAWLALTLILIGKVIDVSQCQRNVVLDCLCNHNSIRMSVLSIYKAIEHRRMSSRPNRYHVDVGDLRNASCRSRFGGHFQSRDKERRRRKSNRTKAKNLA